LHHFVVNFIHQSFTNSFAETCFTSGSQGSTQKKKKKPILQFHQEVGDSRANTCMKVTNIANVISRKKKGENKL
jgi:hypothetical protein